jgi:hypothetical protein
MDTTIMTDQTTKSTYADVVAALRGIADAIEAIDSTGLDPQPWVQVGIQPHPRLRGEDETIVRTVDAFAQALIGKPGTTEHLQSSGAIWHHSADGTVLDRVKVSVYGRVVSPTERELRAEAEHLRAERDDFRNAAKMYAATVDDLRRQIDPMRAELDGQAQVAAAVLTPDEVA